MLTKATSKTNRTAPLAFGKAGGRDRGLQPRTGQSKSEVLGQRARLPVAQRKTLWLRERSSVLALGCTAWRLRSSGLL